MNKALIDRLCTQYGSSDPDVRSAAVAEIKSQAPAAGAAIPALLEYLSHPDAVYRNGALFILGWMGTGAIPAIPAVANVLQNTQEDLAIRTEAAWALWKIGARSIPALIRALEQGDVTACRLAAVRLGSFGERAASAGGALCQRLHHAELTVVREAAGALTKIGSNAISLLEQVLVTNTSVARVYAASALLAIDRAHRQAKDVAIESLNDPNVDVRAHAACTLLDDAGTLAELSTKDYFALLRDECCDVRSFAALALRNSGPSDDKEVLPALVAAFADDDLSVLAFVVQAVGDFGEAALPVLPNLVKMLDNYSVDPSHVVAAIGNIGPKARKVLPLLESRLEEYRRRLGANNPETVDSVEDEYLEALQKAISTIQGRIPPEPAIPCGRLQIDALIHLLGSGDAAAGLAAHRELTRRGEEAIDSLREVLANFDDSRLLPALAVLRELGPRSATILPLLKELYLNKELVKKYKHFSRAVTLVFVAVGSQSIPVVKALLRNKDCPNRELLNEVLQRLEA